MIDFTLPCVPTAQARARHGVVNGHSVTYKAGAQRANEQTLDALLAPHAPEVPMAGAVELQFLAVFPPRFWEDDRQVVRIVCEKRYGGVGRWEVVAREVREVAI